MILPIHEVVGVWLPSVPRVCKNDDHPGLEVFGGHSVAVATSVVFADRPGGYLSAHDLPFVDSNFRVEVTTIFIISRQFSQQQVD